MAYSDVLAEFRALKERLAELHDEHPELDALWSAYCEVDPELLEQEIKRRQEEGK